MTVWLKALSSVLPSVTRDQTSILAQSFEWADEIDVDRAEKAKALAEERMQQYKDDQRALDIAEYKLKRAINRINTANFKL